MTLLLLFFHHCDMDLRRVEENSVSQLENVKGENGAEGMHYVYRKFKELYIDGRVVQDDSKEQFYEECRKVLDNGYKFRFIIVISYVSDLSSAKTFSKKSLQNAKKAFECLLSYGVNLCRYPEQKEYNLIKKYTAYFSCNIEDNLSPSPEIADTILKTMGYKLADSGDELVLPKVSRIISEVCFELLMGQVELDRIISVLDFAYKSFELSYGESIDILEEYVLSKKTVWCQKDCEQFIEEKFCQTERHIKKPNQRKSHALKIRGRESEMSNTITRSGPQSLSNISEQKKRTFDRSMSDENNDWMYGKENTTTEPISQYSSKSNSDQREALVISSTRHMHHQQAREPGRSKRESSITSAYHLEKSNTGYTESNLKHSEGLVCNHISGGPIFIPPSPSSLPYHLDLHSNSGMPDGDSPMGHVDFRKQDLEDNANSAFNANGSRRRSNSMTRAFPATDMYLPGSYRRKYRPPGVQANDVLQDRRMNDVDMPRNRTVGPLPSNGKQDADNTSTRMRSSPVRRSAPSIYQAERYENVSRYDIPQDKRMNDVDMPRNPTVRPLTSNGEQDADNTSTRMRSSPVRRSAPGIYQAEHYENVSRYDIPQDKRMNDVDMPRNPTVRPLTSNGEQDADNTSTRMRSSPVRRSAPGIYQAEHYENVSRYDIPQDKRMNDVDMPRNPTVRPLTSNGEQDADNTSTRMRSSPTQRNALGNYHAERYENVSHHDIPQDKRMNDVDMPRNPTVRPLTSNDEQDAYNISSHMKSSPLPLNVPDIYKTDLNDSPPNYTSSEAQMDYQYRRDVIAESKSEPMHTTKVEPVHGTYWDRKRTDNHVVEISRDFNAPSLISSSKQDADTVGIRTVSRKEHLGPEDNELADSSLRQYMQEKVPVDPVGQGSQQYTHLKSQQPSCAFSANGSSQSDQQQQRRNLKETKVPSFEKPRSFDVKKDTPAIYGEPVQNPKLTL